MSSSASSSASRPSTACATRPSWRQPAIRTAPARLVDVAPTLLALAGIRDPLGKGTDLTTGTSEPEPAYLENYRVRHTAATLLGRLGPKAVQRLKQSMMLEISPTERKRILGREAWGMLMQPRR